MSKALRISNAEIVVTPNDLMSDGYFYGLKMFGILPNCKKEVQLHVSSAMRGVSFRPLFGRSVSAVIDPSTFKALVARTPVVAYPYGEPFTVTPEMEVKARQAVSKFADSPVPADCESYDVCPVEII